MFGFFGDDIDYKIDALPVTDAGVLDKVNILHRLRIQRNKVVPVGHNVVNPDLKLPQTGRYGYFFRHLVYRNVGQRKACQQAVARGGCRFLCI